MSVEPHNVRFQIGTRVLPPSYTKPIPKPKLSMAEDAALIKRRYKKAWGVYADYGADNDPNLQRKADAEERRQKLQAAILALIEADGGATSKQINAETKATESQIRQTIRILGRLGKITPIRRNRDGWLWVKA